MVSSYIILVLLGVTEWSAGAFRGAFQAVQSGAGNNPITSARDYCRLDRADVPKPVRWRSTPEHWLCWSGLNR
jgi:hypothetical protein